MNGQQLNTQIIPTTQQQIDPMQSITQTINNIVNSTPIPYGSTPTRNVYFDPNTVSELLSNFGTLFEKYASETQDELVKNIYLYSADILKKKSLEYQSQAFQQTQQLAIEPPQREIEKYYEALRDVYRQNIKDLGYEDKQAEIYTNAVMDLIFNENPQAVVNIWNRYGINRDELINLTYKLPGFKIDDKLKPKLANLHKSYSFKEFIDPAKNVIDPKELAEWTPEPFKDFPVLSSAIADTIGLVASGVAGLINAFYNWSPSEIPTTMYEYNYFRKRKLLEKAGLKENTLAMDIAESLGQSAGSVALWGASYVFPVVAPVALTYTGLKSIQAGGGAMFESKMAGAGDFTSYTRGILYGIGEFGSEILIPAEKYLGGLVRKPTKSALSTIIKNYLTAAVGEGTEEFTAGIWQGFWDLVIGLADSRIWSQLPTLKDFFKELGYEAFLGFVGGAGGGLVYETGNITRYISGINKYKQASELVGVTKEVIHGVTSHLSDDGEYHVITDIVPDRVRLEVNLRDFNAEDALDILTKIDEARMNEIPLSGNLITLRQDLMTYIQTHNELMQTEDKQETAALRTRLLNIGNTITQKIYGDMRTLQELSAIGADLSYGTIDEIIKDGRVLYRIEMVKPAFLYNLQKNITNTNITPYESLEDRLAHEISHLWLRGVSPQGIAEMAKSVNVDDFIKAAARYGVDAKVAIMFLSNPEILANLDAIELSDPQMAHNLRLARNALEDVLIESKVLPLVKNASTEFTLARYYGVKDVLEFYTMAADGIVERGRPITIPNNFRPVPYNVKEANTLLSNRDKVIQATTEELVGASFTIANTEDLSTIDDSALRRAYGIINNIINRRDFIPPELYQQAVENRNKILLNLSKSLRAELQQLAEDSKNVTPQQFLEHTHNFLSILYNLSDTRFTEENLQLASDLMTSYAEFINSIRDKVEVKEDNTVVGINVAEAPIGPIKFLRNVLVGYKSLLKTVADSMELGSTDLESVNIYRELQHTDAFNNLRESIQQTSEALDKSIERLESRLAELGNPNDIISPTVKESASLHQLRKTDLVEALSNLIPEKKEQLELLTSSQLKDVSEAINIKGDKALASHLIDVYVEENMFDTEHSVYPQLLEEFGSEALEKGLITDEQLSRYSNEAENISANVRISEKLTRNGINGREIYRRLYVLSRIVENIDIPFDYMQGLRDIGSIRNTLLRLRKAIHTAEILNRFVEEGQKINIDNLHKAYTSLRDALEEALRTATITKQMDFSAFIERARQLAKGTTQQEQTTREETTQEQIPREEQPREEEGQEEQVREERLREEEQVREEERLSEEQTQKQAPTQQEQLPTQETEGKTETTEETIRKETEPTPEEEYQTKIETQGEQVPTTKETVEKRKEIIEEKKEEKPETPKQEAKETQTQKPRKEKTEETPSTGESKIDREIRDKTARITQMHADIHTRLAKLINKQVPDRYNLLERELIISTIGEMPVTALVKALEDKLFTELGAFTGKGVTITKGIYSFVAELESGAGIYMTHIDKESLDIRAEGKMRHTFRFTASNIMSYLNSIRKAFNEGKINTVNETLVKINDCVRNLLKGLSEISKAYDAINPNDEHKATDLITVYPEEYDEYNALKYISGFMSALSEQNYDLARDYLTKIEAYKHSIQQENPKAHSFILTEKPEFVEKYVTPAYYNHQVSGDAYTLLGKLTLKITPKYVKIPGIVNELEKKFYKGMLYGPDVQLYDVFGAELLYIINNALDPDRLIDIPGNQKAVFGAYISVNPSIKSELNNILNEIKGYIHNEMSIWKILIETFQESLEKPMPEREKFFYDTIEQKIGSILEEFTVNVEMADTDGNVVSELSQTDKPIAILKLDPYIEETVAEAVAILQMLSDDTLEKEGIMTPLKNILIDHLSAYNNDLLRALDDITEHNTERLYFTPLLVDTNTVTRAYLEKNNVTKIEMNQLPAILYEVALKSLLPGRYEIDKLDDIEHKYLSKLGIIETETQNIVKDAILSLDALKEAYGDTFVPRVETKVKLGREVLLETLFDTDLQRTIQRVLRLADKFVRNQEDPDSPLQGIRISLFDAIDNGENTLISLAVVLMATELQGMEEVKNVREAIKETKTYKNLASIDYAHLKNTTESAILLYELMQNAKEIIENMTEEEETILVPFIDKIMYSKEFEMGMKFNTVEDIHRAGHILNFILQGIIQIYEQTDGLYELNNKVIEQTKEIIKASLLDEKQKEAVDALVREIPKALEGPTTEKLEKIKEKVKSDEDLNRLVSLVQLIRSIHDMTYISLGLATKLMNIEMSTTKNTLVILNDIDISELAGVIRSMSVTEINETKKMTREFYRALQQVTKRAKTLATRKELYNKIITEYGDIIGESEEGILIKVPPTKVPIPAIVEMAMIANRKDIILREILAKDEILEDKVLEKVIGKYLSNFEEAFKDNQISELDIISFVNMTNGKPTKATPKAKALYDLFASLLALSKSYPLSSLNDTYIIAPGNTNVRPVWIVDDIKLGVKDEYTLQILNKFADLIASIHPKNPYRSILTELLLLPLLSLPYGIYVEDRFIKANVLAILDQLGYIDELQEWLDKSSGISPKIAKSISDFLKNIGGEMIHHYNISTGFIREEEKVRISKPKSVPVSQQQIIDHYKDFTSFCQKDFMKSADAIREAVSYYLYRLKAFIGSFVKESTVYLKSLPDAEECFRLFLQQPTISLYGVIEARKDLSDLLAQIVDVKEVVENKELRESEEGKLAIQMLKDTLKTEDLSSVLNIPDADLAYIKEFISRTEKLVDAITTQRKEIVEKETFVSVEGKYSKFHPVSVDLAKEFGVKNVDDIRAMEKIISRVSHIKYLSSLSKIVGKELISRETTSTFKLVDDFVERQEDTTTFNSDVKELLNSEKESLEEEIQEAITNNSEVASKFLDDAAHSFILLPENVVTITSRFDHPIPGETSKQRFPKYSTTAIGTTGVTHSLLKQRLLLEGLPKFTYNLQLDAMEAATQLPNLVGELKAIIELPSYPKEQLIELIDNIRNCLEIIKYRIAISSAVGKALKNFDLGWMNIGVAKEKLEDFSDLVEDVREEIVETAKRNSKNLNGTNPTDTAYGFITDMLSSLGVTPERNILEELSEKLGLVRDTLSASQLEYVDPRLIKTVIFANPNMKGIVDKILSDSVRTAYIVQTAIELGIAKDFREFREKLENRTFKYEEIATLARIIANEVHNASSLSTKVYSFYVNSLLSSPITLAKNLSEFVYGLYRMILVDHGEAMLYFMFGDTDKLKATIARDKLLVSTLWGRFYQLLKSNIKVTMENKLSGMYLRMMSLESAVRTDKLPPVPTAKTAYGRAFWKTITMPTTILYVVDEIAKTTFGFWNAVKNAAEEGIKQGITDPNELRQFILRDLFVEDNSGYIINRNSQSWIKAINEMEKVTYTEAFENSKIRALHDMLKYKMGGKWLVPFTTVIANITKVSVRNSIAMVPIELSKFGWAVVAGLLDKDAKSIKDIPLYVKKHYLGDDPEKKLNKLAEALIGIIFLYILPQYAMNLYSDWELIPKRKSRFQRTDIPEGSIVTKNGNVYNIRNLDPFYFTIVLNKKIHSAVTAIMQKYQSGVLNSREAIELTRQVSDGLLDEITDFGALRTLHDLDIVVNDPTYISRLALNWVGGFVPNLLKYIFNRIGRDELYFGRITSPSNPADYLATITQIPLGIRHLQISIFGNPVPNPLGDNVPERVFKSAIIGIAPVPFNDIRAEEADLYRMMHSASVMTGKTAWYMPPEEILEYSYKRTDGFGSLKVAIHPLHLKEMESVIGQLFRNVLIANKPQLEYLYKTNPDVFLDALDQIHSNISREVRNVVKNIYYVPAMQQLAMYRSRGYVGDITIEIMPNDATPLGLEAYFNVTPHILTRFYSRE